MRYFLGILIVILSMAICSADQPVKQVVKHFDNMRLVYTTGNDGKKVPLITNIDENGKRMGPPVAPAPDWNKSYRIQAAKQERSAPAKETLRNSNAVGGIPYPTDRSPVRTINPYQVVNPYTDPTAIPTNP